ncbi:MAG: carbohydrate-binding domain-containing protein [Bacteroidales bacterium]|nr:carbohydrate-binding domain-containing protein [Bacteroidales bacterium]
MKKIYLSLLLAAVAATAHAQWVRVWSAGDSERYAISETASIPYATSGSTLTIGSDTYSTADIDSITVVNPVTITWNGTSATVDIPDTAEGVTATISGGDVVINNTCTTIEHEFILTGSSSAGSLTYNGEYKTKFHLNGVSLTSTSGAALDIQCGKRIDLYLEDGTTNSLTDAAGGSHKAAFNCQGHLEVAGGGTLNVAGYTNHGIRSKEYLYLKQSVGTINVTAAVTDGIHCGEYFTMNGGTINISGHGSDGLQMEMDDSSDEADNGIFTMNGGTINVTHTSAGSKAIRADSTLAVMNINGGTIDIDMTSTATDSKGLVCDGDMNINETSATTTITIDVAGEGYLDDNDEKVRSTGVKCEDTITYDGGTTTINATGKYSRGMRAGTLIINDGTLTVKNTGTSSQGIKLDNTVVKNGGTVSASFKY